MASSPDVAVSAADCRLSAFATVTDATRCWIKVPARLPSIRECHSLTFILPRFTLKVIMWFLLLSTLCSSSWPRGTDTSCV